MVERWFQSADWFHGTTLAERIAARRAPDRTRVDVRIDTELAQRRFTEWRSQEPFTDDSLFHERLTAEGLDEEAFLHLLGEPPQSVRDRFPSAPLWLVTLATAFSQTAPSTPIPRPKALAGGQSVAFLDAIEPLISHGRARLRDGIQSIARSRPDLPIDPTTIDDIFYTNLPGRLLMMLSRTAVLELHVARLEGLLRGDSPHERFQHFIERLRQPDVTLALLEEYPVLARQLVICIEQWVMSGLTFVRHLAEDWNAVQTTVTVGADPGVVVEIQSAGDGHQGGQSVLLLRFSSGFRLVYKPRSLAVDAHFQQLLDWLNERGSHPPFRTLKVLDRGTHGWVEFVATAGCTSPEQVERFYERIGGHLALLYALEATDIHAENLAAAGEHPVLLDLETVCGPRITAERARMPADQIAVEAMQSSVLRVMLLPRRIWHTEKSDGIDLGGLVNQEGQLTPYAVSRWEYGSTDEMRLVRKRVVMSGSGNTPTLNGHGLDALDYVEAIVAGFVSIYSLLERHREDLLSDDGPLAPFANDEVRVVLRPTQTYAALLRESYHPDALRNGLDRDRLFDRLWVHADDIPCVRSLIGAERADLHRGDIPRFTTRPNARNLWSAPDRCFPGVLHETGMSMVRARLEQLSERDRATQVWYIRASLATTAAGTGRTRRITPRGVAVEVTADREGLLTAARAVADRLAALAVRSHDDATWTGLTRQNERHVAPGPLGTDLYDGLPGIVLFLAHLGEAMQERAYRALAQAALTALRRCVERSRAGTRPAITRIGAFTGWGGLIYTLTHLGALWQQGSLLDDAQAFVERLRPLIAEDSELDIVEGAAGAIMTLLGLYQAQPSERTLTAAIECGLHLQHCVDAAERTFLTGFSHGAAGMASALLQLASVSGDGSFAKTAMKLIAHERRLFNPDRGNWPDLRIPDEAIFQVTWCHGAPGIGMARLRSLEFVDDSQIRAEIDAALETTVAEGFGGNHSLCHGDLGNTDLLLLASARLADPRWPAESHRFAGTILGSIERNGWLCGVPLTVETPGLMTGLAGIGYGLLRLAVPTQVPSVLTLEGAVGSLRLVGVSHAATVHGQ
jgi:type 2 lantibiotic biosynthesis protein LanM